MIKKLLPLSAALLFASHTMAFDNYKEATVSDIQQAFKSGELTSVELVKYYQQQIKQQDKAGKELNSVLSVNPNVLEMAKKRDAERAAGKSLGPLHGIPVLIKGNIDNASGLPNTAGSVLLKENFPKHDAFMVDQLKQAGAIILGQANLSEWANFRSTRSSSGWSGMGGQAKNPYDVTRSPCGSSSGSGVATAANLTMVAIGTETDGSVTCPSAVNGIVGIKPTLGLVSREGIIPIAHSQDTAGPMARTVTDAVLLLDAMVAFDKQDKQAVKGDNSYQKYLNADGLKGKRIGVVRSLAGYNDQLDEVLEQQLVALKSAGAVLVDELKLEGMEEVGGMEYSVLLHEFKADLNAYLAKANVPGVKDLEQLIALNKKYAEVEMPHFAQEIFEMAQAKDDLTNEDYLKAQSESKRLSQLAIDGLLKEHKLDALIAPTTSPAWKIDHVNGDNFSGSASQAAAVSGYPHITVPMGYVKGLPVGLSFFSGQLSEGKLIEAAFAFEQATKARKAPF